jgi:hypothetical protein
MITCARFSALSFMALLGNEIHFFRNSYDDNVKEVKFGGERQTIVADGS